LEKTALLLLDMAIYVSSFKKSNLEFIDSSANWSIRGNRGTFSTPGYRLWQTQMDVARSLTRLFPSTHPGSEDYTHTAKDVD